MFEEITSVQDPQHEEPFTVLRPIKKKLGPVKATVPRPSTALEAENPVSPLLPANTPSAKEERPIELSVNLGGSIFDSFELPPKNERPMLMPTNFIDEIDEPEDDEPDAV